MVGGFDARDDVEEGGFSAAGGAANGNEFSTGDGDIDSAKDLDFSVIKAFGDLLDFDGGSLSLDHLFKTESIRGFDFHGVKSRVESARNAGDKGHGNDGNDERG